MTIKLMGRTTPAYRRAYSTAACPERLPNRRFRGTLGTSERDADLRPQQNRIQQDVGDARLHLVAVRDGDHEEVGALRAAGTVAPGGDALADGLCRRIVALGGN